MAYVETGKTWVGITKADKKLDLIVDWTGVTTWHPPKQSITLWEIPQNYHTFALFGVPKMGPI